MSQFHITNWTAGDQFPDMKNVITMIDNIAKVQRKTGNNTIVVHGRYIVSHLPPASCSNCI